MTIRFAISSAERPLYVQTTLTTGMSMFGKMSVGVRMIASGPRIEQQHGQHDEGVRPPQRESDDPHGVSFGRWAVRNCPVRKDDVGAS